MKIYKVIYILSKDQTDDNVQEITIKTILAETLEGATAMAVRMMRSAEIPLNVRKVAVLNANDESECHEIHCSNSFQVT